MDLIKAFGRKFIHYLIILSGTRLHAAIYHPDRARILFYTFRLGDWEENRVIQSDMTDNWSETMTNEYIRGLSPSVKWQLFATNYESIYFILPIHYLTRSKGNHGLPCIILSYSIWIVHSRFERLEIQAIE